MNVNIILDSDYICNKLSEGKEDLINSLFVFMKTMSNIIIIQDSERNIIRKIINHEKIQDQEIKFTEIFLNALIQGTNQYDFISQEKYEGNFLDFVKKIQDKDYPLQMIITDKKINGDIKSYPIENLDEITKMIKKFSEKHHVTNNEETLVMNTKKNFVSHDEYENILFNTFWCSTKITIVGKEFFDGSVISPFKKDNSKNFTESLKCLIKTFKRIENYTNKKTELEIITGIKKKQMDKHDWKMHHKKLSDEAYKVLEISDDLNIKLSIFRWDIGDEITTGEGHGRRIYSDYGGLDTGFMPLDLFTTDKEPKLKDTSFHWIGEEERINPISFMNILAQRPN